MIIIQEYTDYTIIYLLYKNRIFIYILNILFITIGIFFFGLSLNGIYRNHLRSGFIIFTKYNFHIKLMKEYYKKGKYIKCQVISVLTAQKHIK